MTQSKVIDSHIQNIVQTQDIHEQSDLQALLKERGFDIPQATLSRRLKSLKIAKVAGIYRIVEFNLATLPPVLNVQISEYGLFVLHTHPGHANSLAYFIDRKYVDFSPDTQNSSGILGTMAGDDTVLLIIRSKQDVPQVIAVLQEEFPYLQIRV